MLLSETYSKTMLTDNVEDNQKLKAFFFLKT